MRILPGEIRSGRSVSILVVFVVLAAFVGVTIVTGCGGRSVSGDDNNNDNGNANDNFNTSLGVWPVGAGPPIDDLGERGWRDSTEPWAADEHEVQLAYAVWSRPEGVYVLHSGFPASGYVGPGDLPERWKISVNEGSGWRTHFEWGTDNIGMGGANTVFYGYPDGRLLLNGAYGEMNELALIADNAITNLTFMAQHAFVVDNDFAYAASAFERKIVRYEAGSWGPVPVDVPYDVIQIWADESALFAVGPFGTVLSLEEENGSPSWLIHDSGSLDDFNTVWGFAEDDVWIGSVTGALKHWDGQAWTEIPWPAQSPYPEGWVSIEQFWGADGVLFFRTYWQLVRCENLQCEEVAYWPCVDTLVEGNVQCDGGVSIRSMWGNSPQEVFLALNTSVGGGSQDETKFLLFYDGQQFHWF